MVLEKNFMGHDEGGRGAAALIYKGAGEAWIARDPSVGCYLYKIPFAHIQGSLPIRKGWPFRGLLDLNILKLHETGILNKIQARWVAPSPERICSGGGGGSTSDDDGGFRCVGADSVQGFFLLLLGGVILSMGAAAAERLTHT